MDEKGYLHRRSDNFGKSPETLIHDPAISDGAARLYAHMHWRYGSTCTNFEGRDSMAAMLHVSDTTITNRLTELEQGDWIVIIPRYTRKGRTSNFYHVFELQADCIAWRDQHKRPKPAASPKFSPPKSRKGIGGQPSHKPKATPVDELPMSTQVDTPTHEPMSTQVESVIQTQEITQTQINTSSIPNGIDVAQAAIASALDTLPMDGNNDFDTLRENLKGIAEQGTTPIQEKVDTPDLTLPDPPEKSSAKREAPHIVAEVRQPDLPPPPDGFQWFMIAGDNDLIHLAKPTPSGTRIKLACGKACHYPTAVTAQAVIGNRQPCQDCQRKAAERATQPPDPTWSPEVKEAFAKLTKKDWSIPSHAKAMSGSLASISKREPVTLEKLRLAYRNWYKCMFKGQKGQAPEPYEVTLKWVELTEGEDCSDGSTRHILGERPRAGKHVIVYDDYPE